jgi:Pvc16 N-terminal domain
MSNHLAIATVTATLGDMVHKAAESAVSSSVSLQFGRPTAPSSGSTERKVHVYLYQVTPNPGLRNNDLPTRDSEGRLTRRPQAALDLHYLLSFYGDDKTLEPDRMVGAVARDLHTRPVLSAQSISDAIGSRSELTGSDLAAASEQVKFVPASLSLDEISKLWSVMVQTPHVLSVVYQGTVVLIDAEESPGMALPVLKRGEGDHGVDTRIGPFPRLDSWWAGAVSAAERAPRPPSFPVAQLGVRLVIEGSNLGGDTVAVKFAHPRLPVQAFDVAAEDRDVRKLAVSLPDDAPAQAAWAAGIYTVTASLKRGATEQSSNVVPIALAPHVTAIQPNPAARDGSSTASLQVTCRPQVLPTQSVTLLLADREIQAQPLGAASDTLTFDIDNAPVLNGALARLRIDGVDSMPFKYDEASRGFVFDDQQRITIT